MEKYTYYTLLLIGALLLLSLLRFIPFHQLFPDIDTEEKMVDITHFDLHDNTSGSLVQGGAMFAGMSDVTRQVIITARIWISPKDFGGAWSFPSLRSGWLQKNTAVIPEVRWNPVLNP